MKKRKMKIEMEIKVNNFFRKKAPTGYALLCSGSHKLWNFFAVYRKTQINCGDNEFIFKSGEPKKFRKKKYQKIDYRNSQTLKTLLIRVQEGMFSFKKNGGEGIYNFKGKKVEIYTKPF